MVERIASPSAPPICCDVLIRPDASPASLLLTPDTAAIVTGTNENPSPAAATSDAGSTSEANVPSTDTREKSSSPIAIKPMPKTSTGLKTSLGKSCDATPAETMIVSASGRYEKPDLSGE